MSRLSIRSAETASFRACSHSASHRHSSSRVARGRRNGSSQSEDICACRRWCVSGDVVGRVLRRIGLTSLRLKSKRGCPYVLETVSSGDVTRAERGCPAAGSSASMSMRADVLVHAGELARFRRCCCPRPRARASVLAGDRSVYAAGSAFQAMSDARGCPCA